MPSKKYRTIKNPAKRGTVKKPARRGTVTARQVDWAVRKVKARREKQSPLA